MTGALQEKVCCLSACRCKARRSRFSLYSHIRAIDWAFTSKARRLAIQRTSPSIGHSPLQPVDWPFDANSMLARRLAIRCQFNEVDYLRHIIEGLTRFNEWERMTAEEALIIFLKQVDV